MSTLVFVHAHPDDEASQTAGAMCRAVAEGHRVVLVVATGGEHGEAPPDLAPGETVADRRRVELAGSAAAIGVHRVEWLGYVDSGMTGAFFTLTNTGSAPIHLASATSPVSPMMQLHETVMGTSGAMAMQEKKGGFTIAALSLIHI